MAAGDVQVFVEGPESEVVANKLADVLFQVFDHRVTPIPAPKEMERDGERGMVGDATALAAAILAIPSAILAVEDLVARIRKKASVDRFLQEAERVRNDHPGITMRIRKPDGTLIELWNLDANAMMDIVGRKSR